MLGFIELSRGEAVAALGYLIRAWEIRDSIPTLSIRAIAWSWGTHCEALIAVAELEEAEQKLDHPS